MVFVGGSIVDGLGFVSIDFGSGINGVGVGGSSYDGTSIGGESSGGSSSFKDPMVLYVILGSVTPLWFGCQGWFHFF